MKFTLVVLLIFLSLGLFSCNTFENENPELLAIQGTWKLESFSGGIIGKSTDMDTVDYSISLEVLQEKASWMFNNKIELTYNVDSRSSSNFLLKFDPIDNNTDAVKLPKYLSEISDNEMVIVDSCYDCYNYYFVKIED